ncbi:unnamed protein product [Prunus armeniaca]|uniref:Uncharacterized protein n=1 Tax=Prunus armeniaca TaxID=36596 RepID=A0A6J5WNZ6_PRUAR|nr:unnamed protein product [Prunus armeniaca]CAB4301362.1 unnamed protein product [Prunus armeniaca]
MILEKRKYDHVISKHNADEDQASSVEASSVCSRGGSGLETKAALEKAAVVQERSNTETQQREDVLREEFATSLAEKVILSLSLSRQLMLVDLLRVI